MSQVDNEIYVFGGQTTEDKVTNDCYRLDLSTMDWKCLHKYVNLNSASSDPDKLDPARLPRLEGIPGPRVDHRACVIHKKIVYIFGAWLDTQGYSSFKACQDCYCFDTGK